jgi:hypothetical protein
VIYFDDRPDPAQALKSALKSHHFTDEELKQVLDSMKNWVCVYVSETNKHRSWNTEYGIDVRRALWKIRI